MTNAQEDGLEALWRQACQDENAEPAFLRELSEQRVVVCSCRSKTDHLCRPKIDQGRKPGKSSRLWISLEVHGDMEKQLSRA